MHKLAHLINPVLVSKGLDYSSLATAQPVTFASIQSARSQARSTADVEILAIGFPEDAAIVPAEFTVTKALQRSVLDIASFNTPRKLPILRDILATGLESTDAEYFVYTNIDIAVTQNFYIAVNTIINRGYDAFTVTRRTVPSMQWEPEDLPLIQSLVGDSHPGHDCFVFHRSILESPVLGETCVGAQYLVPPLLANLICRAKKFGRFNEFHLTFHLGDDRVWQTEKFRDYADFNFAQAAMVLQQLDALSLLVPSPLISMWIDRFAPTIAHPIGPSVHVPLWHVGDGK